MWIDANSMEVISTQKLVIFSVYEHCSKSDLWESEMS